VESNKTFENMIGMLFLGICVGILGLFFIFFLPNLNASRIERSIAEGILKGLTPEQLIRDWLWSSDEYKYISYNKSRVQERFLRSWIHSVDRNYFTKTYRVDSFQTIDDWYQYVIDQNIHLMKNTDFSQDEEKFAALYFKYSIINTNEYRYLFEKWKDQNIIKIDKIDDAMKMVEEIEEKYIKMSQIRSFFEGNAVWIQGMEQFLMRGITDAFTAYFVYYEKKICAAISEHRQHIDGNKVKFSQISQMLKDEMIPLKVRVKIEDAYKVLEKV
jgi:hypothetical protein